MTRFSLVMLRRLYQDLLELHPERKEEIADVLRLAAIGLAVHTYLEHMYGAFGWSVGSHMGSDRDYMHERSTTLWNAVRDGYSFVLEL